MSNNTGLGNRQTPSQKEITAFRLKFRPSQDINLTMDCWIYYYEAYSVILQQPKGTYTSNISAIRENISP